MSVATVACRAQLGLHAPLVEVEVSLGPGLPVFSIVGLAATVVKESKDRVRAALLNSGFQFPAGRIVVSLSPADIPKRGGRFDLPIAVGILLASGQVRRAPALRLPSATPIEFYGELGLSGELKGVPGILLAAAHAARDGHEVIVPQANGEEVGLLGRGHAHVVGRAADHLLSVCRHVNGTQALPPLSAARAVWSRAEADQSLDLRDVHGQLQAKRALAVAAAGGHSLLMIGPPGAGKSMLARRLPGLLPPMSESEALEVAAIASVSNAGFQFSSFGRRPVRTPHHSTSAVALVGGGAGARPGEISLAHHGVLFLDELLEYDRRALESLREPLEAGVVCVARAAHQAQYPAEFQLVAAMNPCPCGRLGDPSDDCRCTPGEISRYRARVSGPLLDRLDIHVEVPRVGTSEYLHRPENRGEDSARIAARVRYARTIQLARQGRCNSRLADGEVDRFCRPDPQGAGILERAMKQFGFSARGRQRILMLARTIADLGGDECVASPHVCEAVTFRALDRRSN